MRRTLRLLALCLALALTSTVATAQSFDLPGLGRDSSAYQSELTRRFPAGAPPAQREAAEQRARTAERANNWPVAAQAWEDRIGMGAAQPDHWLGLARAQLARTPPENNRALQAAWRAFQLAPAGEPEIPSLLVIAEALRRLNRPVQQVEALEAVLERAQGNSQYARMLEDARRAAGMLVRRVQTEPEAEPARTCITFTQAPARRTDWRPEDWVRTDPPIPSIAVEREGDAICIAGLPWGRTTRILLRAGLPAEGGGALKQDAEVAVAVPNRPATIAFDTRAFLLPRGQEARVTVATVNVTALKIRLLRVSERNLVPLRQSWTPGEALETWGGAENVGDDAGRLIWEGRAEIPGFEANRTQRTILPLPEAFRSAAPGLFVLLVQADDGRDVSASAALPLLATDLGLTVWRGADGVAVQVRSLQSAGPKPGVRLMLMARNNDILAEATTDAEGMARFAAPLLRGTGPVAPVAIHAEAGDDLAALNLDAAAFDLSDRGATGLPSPGPVDVFLWLDRGIYRPGETVNVAGMLRDSGGAPLDLPVRLRLRKPNGQVAQENLPQRQGDSSILWPLRLSNGAPFGLWTVEALTDPNLPPVGRAQFRVDAFVPERLEVTAGPVPGPLVPGRPLRVPVTARFLYGAPGAGLTGSAEMRLVTDPEPFPDWKGWRFGLAQEEFAPDLQSFDIGETDDQGRSTLTLELPQAPDTTRPVRAEVAVSIGEPGGRESRTRFAVPVRARGNLVAVRPAFQDDAIDEGKEAGFDIAAVNPEGRAIAGNLHVRLVRERPNWRIVTRGSIARWETVWRDEPVDAQQIRVAPNAPFRFARTLSFGRYRLEVQDANGLGITSIRFRSGWAGVEAAEVPDRVDVAADRRAYNPGDTARIRIQPPFGGQASVAVLTDRLVSIRDITLPEAGAEIEVPVEASWGPGAYVTVTVFRPGEARNGQPGRALGLAWVALDPDSRRLAVTIDTPDRIRPRQRVEIPVRIANAQGPAYLTLAAVDEGILRLTNFPNPDPVGHFLGRRRLGVDIRDDYGRLIAPADGELAALRQGGDEGEGDNAIQPPQRIVSLFSGIVQAGPDGTARIPLDIPDFAGELRLMAVAWQGTRIGNAARPLTVRDEIVGEALLPRFLAPGDEARITMLLHNVELPAGEVTAELTASGAIALAGPARLTASLRTGERVAPRTAIRGTESGEGVLRVAVTGPNDFRVERESRITVRSSRPRLTEIAGAELPPGVEKPLTFPAERFIPGTWRASATFGAAVRYDSAALLRAVENYGFYCLEQSASSALALSAGMEDGGTDDRAIRLQRAVDSILDKQRFDGAFGMWSAQGEPQQWLTPYAMEALLRARAAGAIVPEGALRDAYRFLEEAVEDAGAGSPEERAAQAYRLHVLAMAGRARMGAARRLFEQINDLPTQLSRAQLGSAFARAGDRTRAEAAFVLALAQTGRRFWIYDYGTARRDALATALLLKESAFLPDRLNALMHSLPGADFTPLNSTTQEQAWAVAAAIGLGQGLRAARIAVNGQPVEPPRTVVVVPLTAPGTSRNLGEGPVWQTVSVTGIPTTPQPAERNGFRLTRRFFATDGQPLNLEQLRQNQSFVLLLELRSDTGETHQALIQQGLPAGWEIATRLPAGDISGMPWLGTLTEPDSQPALDDRYAAAVAVSPGQAFARLAVRLRAVTPGNFEFPGGEATDMYRPGTFARQTTTRITVAPSD